MEISPQKIEISEFNYDLPSDRIAKHPLPVRDQSRLLLYSDGEMKDHRFNELHQILQRGDLLIMNSTRVIPARLYFKKSTGGVIEIFCLEPESGSHQDAMNAKSGTKWKCLIGGAKKWKNNEVVKCVAGSNDSINLSATQQSKSGDSFIIEFTWSPAELTFSEVLLEAGKIPLPPYFEREEEPEDLERYQTVFARREGSVAAPTAGLHFTDELLSSLEQKGIETEKLVLHVGAGTFKPVSSQTIGEHSMHGEVFSISLQLLKKLMELDGNKRIVAVGTTSMRALESLYWLGILEFSKQHSIGPTSLHQWDAYRLKSEISFEQSIRILYDLASLSPNKEYTASTSIMIAPGFQFRICSGLITNYHLPQSTLLVLVSAFIGNDWKKIYQHALHNDYRFLSYGDSSLLWKKDKKTPELK